MLTDFTFFGQIFPLISLLATLADRRPHYQVLTVTAHLHSLLSLLNAHTCSAVATVFISALLQTWIFCTLVFAQYLFVNTVQFCTCCLILTSARLCYSTLDIVANIAKHCKTLQNIAKHRKTLHCNIAPGSSTVCSASERKTSDTSANADAIILLTAFANFPNRPLTLLIQQNNVDFPSSPTDIAARRGIIIYPGGGSSHPTGNLATV